MWQKAFPFTKNWNPLLKGVIEKNERPYVEKLSMAIATSLTSTCCFYEEKIVKNDSYRRTQLPGPYLQGGACPPLLEFETYYNSHCCWTTKFQVKTPKLFLEMKLICSLLLSYNLNFQKMKLICSLLLSYNMQSITEL